jgi:hypothetical protein
LRAKREFTGKDFQECGTVRRTTQTKLLAPAEGSVKETGVRNQR